MVVVIDHELIKLQKIHGFNYDIIHYSDDKFYHIKITELYMTDSELDLTRLVQQNQQIDLNIDIENSHFYNSKLQLPPSLNLIEFVDCSISSTQITISKNVSMNKDMATSLNNSPIIGIHKTKIDSLTTFDNIEIEFILQCVESEIRTLHTSHSLPNNLIIAGITESKIIDLGTIRTNSILKLLSIEILDTKDDIFLLEIYSNRILKIRFVGPDTTSLIGSIKFYTNTPNLYFVDLMNYQLSIPYDPNSRLPELISQLSYFKLPKDAIIEEKMRALLRLVNTSIF